VMHQPFALQARANARCYQQIDDALFKNTGADALFDIFPAARFDDDGFDSLQVEKMREKKSGRARSHNSDLRAQIPPPEVLATPKLRAV